MNTLRVDWYIDYDANPTTAPPSKKKLAYVPFPGGPPTERLADYARAAPGSYWYIWGEPNRYSAATPRSFVTFLDATAGAIKASDPSAMIVGPSILNWHFTCQGCNGFTSGATWMGQFFDEYEDVHGLGARPPIDVYAIDLYPLTWTGALPMTNWVVLKDDLLAYRAWLNSKGLSNRPIWVTEVASHWAYSAWIKDANDNLTIPSHLDWDRDYNWAAMETFIYNLFDWLRRNGDAQNIRRWFLFITYTNIRTSGDYAGIYLFETDKVGAPLNRLGQLYRDMALGLR